MLRFAGVSKQFRGQRVLSNLSFSVAAGEVVLLIGANGSGKSTALKMAAQLLSPDAGEVLIHGSDSKAKPRIGYLGHQLGLYPALTVTENLALFSTLTRSPLSASEILEEAQLLPLKDQLVRDLSRGQQQRVALVRATLGAPQLLLLDEPTAPLDDGATAALTTSLRAAAARGAAVLIVTHDIARLSAGCSRVIRLAEGVVADEGSGSDGIAQVVAAYQRGNR